MYDAKTEEYRTADALRKQLPELRRLPDGEAFIARLVLGSRALTERATNTPGKKPASAAQPAKAKSPATPARKAPLAPGDGSQALGSVLDRPGSRQADSSSSVKRFTETRSRNDLKAALRGLVFTQ